MDNFPFTPMLMRMQAKKASHQKIQDAAGEIMGLLNDFTFSEQEERILQILAGFSPEDFIRAIKLLSVYVAPEGWRKSKDVSYLQRLYEDMHGEEYLYLCEMMKSKLLALKAGSEERFNEIQAKVAAGETTPEIPTKMDFGPFRLTAPTSWERHAFPVDAEFTADGSLRGKWFESIGYRIEHINDRSDVAVSHRPFRMEIEDLFVVSHIHSPGKHDFASLLEIKSMSDKLHRDFIFTHINLVGIVFGVGAMIAATTAVKLALTGLFQVAIPAAGQVVTDHEEEILDLKYGREFLFAWNAVNVFMAAYGVKQLFSPAGRSLIESLTKLKDDLIRNNPALAVVNKVGEKTSEFLAALKKVKKDVFDKGIELLSKDSDGGELTGIMAALKKRKPIDPAVPPPLLTRGECIATGKSELEILYEMKKHPDPSKLDVFQKDNGESFLLAERTGNDVTDRPTGYTRCTRFSKIIDLYEDYESAKKKLLDAIKFHIESNSGVEIGIYKKMLNEKVYYVVIEGNKGSVERPAQGWAAVGHYHHGAGANPKLRNPAIQDVTLALQPDGPIGAPITKKQTEIIFSHDKQGRLIEIEYGADPNDPAGPYFVKTIDGLVKKFKDMYPDELQAKVNEIQLLLEDQRLSKLVDLFKDLPPKYYASFWAKGF